MDYKSSEREQTSCNRNELLNRAASAYRMENKSAKIMQLESNIINRIDENELAWSGHAKLINNKTLPKVVMEWEREPSD